MVQTELGQREFTVGLVLREPADALSSRYMTAFATLEAIKAGDSTDKLIWAVEFVSLDFFLSCSHYQLVHKLQLSDGLGTQSWVGLRE